MRLFIQLLSINSLVAGAIAATDLPADPVRSPVWEHRIEMLFGKDAKIAIDKGIIVDAPSDAEDQFQVPVTIDASAFSRPIDEIFVYADLNPIPEVLSFKPFKTEPYISFRMKLQQASPIRAAIKSGNTWYIASTWVEAAGGGCTAPAEQHALNNWHDTLGQTRGRFFNQTNKLKFAIQHPMDTGLADGIPEFYIRKIQVYNADKSAELAEIVIHQPVSENPTFSLKPLNAADVGSFIIEGMDNNGNEIDALVSTE